MPLFIVTTGEHFRNQLADLETAIRNKILGDGQQYVVTFYPNNPRPEESDSFLIRAEYGVIGPLMVNLAKEHDNFRVEYPANLTGIGMKWAEVSGDDAV
jgi:hypothetical protein